MARYRFIAVIILLTIVLSGCATQNELVGTQNEKGIVAGFWYGLWHGLIVLVTLMISLFKDSVSIYEVHNTGFGYNAGFVLGVLIWGGCCCGDKGICNIKKKC